MILNNNNKKTIFSNNNDSHSPSPHRRRQPFPLSYLTPSPHEGDNRFPLGYLTSPLKRDNRSPLGYLASCLRSSVFHREQTATSFLLGREAKRPTRVLAAGGRPPYPCLPPTLFFKPRGEETSVGRVYPCLPASRARQRDQPVSSSAGGKTRILVFLRAGGRNKVSVS